MHSLYMDERWAILQSRKEEGDLEQYHFESELGNVDYRFFKRFAGKIGETDYYDIASYRGAEGPYLSACVSENVPMLIELFIEDFEKYCEEKRIIAEFCKLDPWTEYAEELRNTLKAEYYGNFYCNDLTRDFYKYDYNRRSKRSIKKAKELGAKVVVDHDGKTIQDFVRLYKNTEDKYHTGNYYNFDEQDIKEYFDILGDDCFLINVIVNKKIITSVLTVMGQDVMHYLFLGNDPDFLEYQGNSLLTYETAVYGKQLGKKLFDMGGGKPGGSIEAFKRNFISDDNVWKYYAVKKIYNHDVYNKLVDEKKVINNPDFFPQYRG